MDVSKIILSSCVVISLFNQAHAKDVIVYDGVGKCYLTAEGKSFLGTVKSIDITSYRDSAGLKCVKGRFTDSENNDYALVVPSKKLPAGSIWNQALIILIKKGEEDTILYSRDGVDDYTFLLYGKEFQLKNKSSLERYGCFVNLERDGVWFPGEGGTTYIYFVADDAAHLVLSTCPSELD